MLDRGVLLRLKDDVELVKAVKDAYDALTNHKKSLVDAELKEILKNANKELKKYIKTDHQLLDF